MLAGLMATPVVNAGEIKLFVPGSMAQIRAAHTGTAHVVALWSLDCPPCHEELATLESFARAHRSIAVVLISTDTPADTPALLHVLQRHGLAGAENWVFADEFVERLRHEIDPDWRGELPRAYLHGANGTAITVTGRLVAGKLEDWLGAQSPPPGAATSGRLEARSARAPTSPLGDP
jgi:thiol-disulfide isomerase/thioredoxin